MIYGPEHCTPGTKLPRATPVPPPYSVFLPTFHPRRDRSGTGSGTGTGENRQEQQSNRCPWTRSVHLVNKKSRHNRKRTRATSLPSRCIAASPREPSPLKYLSAPPPPRFHHPRINSNRVFLGVVLAFRFRFRLEFRLLSPSPLSYLVRAATTSPPVSEFLRIKRHEERSKSLGIG